MSKLAQAERLLSALLSLATIAGVGILIDNRFRPPEPSGGRSRIEEVENWAQRSLPLATAVSDGAAGSVSVTTFTDYECPMCRIADSVLRVLDTSTRVIDRKVIPFPLPGHRNAMAAAEALECAASQGRASAMHTALYQSSSEFSTAPWVRLSRVAGVHDSAAFALCLSAESTKTKVLAGLELGRQLKISGTPAFVVNGTLYDAVPLDEVERAIRKQQRSSPRTP
ncbi:MAG: thioredoxin domain-containing protein [Gemmatimonadaceae bacterium]|jgi:protein-disulfide isomerase|nr:thioredoxin domain-containing protein [Gemmatimonadaceae bacterium]